MHKAGQSELESRAAQPAHPWARWGHTSGPRSLWSLLAAVSSQLQEAVVIYQLFFLSPLPLLSFQLSVAALVSVIHLVLEILGKKEKEGS